MFGHAHFVHGSFNRKIQSVTLQQTKTMKYSAELRASDALKLVQKILVKSLIKVQ